jgi:hypothetical protein
MAPIVPVTARTGRRGEKAGPRVLPSAGDVDAIPGMTRAEAKPRSAGTAHEKRVRAVRGRRVAEKGGEAEAEAEERAKRCRVETKACLSDHCIVNTFKHLSAGHVTVEIYLHTACLSCN